MQVINPLSDKKPYEWQNKIIKLLTDDKKKVQIYIDHSSTGKTAFAKSILLNNPRSVLYLTAAREKNIKDSVVNFLSDEKNDLKMVIFDLPEMDKKDSLTAIHSLKDGIFHHKKVVLFNPVSVVILTSHDVEHKLSSWETININ